MSIVLCQELVHREVCGVLLAGVGNRVSVLVLVPVVVVVHGLAQRLPLQRIERWALGPRVLDALRLHRQKGRVPLWGQLAVPVVVVVLRGVLHRLRGTIVAAIIGRVVVVVITAFHTTSIVLCQELVHRKVCGVLLAGVGDRVSVLVLVPIVVVVHGLAQRLLLQRNERWALGP